MRHLDRTEILQQVTTCIREIDAMLALVGLSALSLSEASYLRPLYEAVYGEPVS